VMFRLPSHVPPCTFIDRLSDKGVKLNYPEGPRIRAVTNRMVETEDIDRVLEQMQLVMREFQSS
ncbi:hypothetical protein KAJ02_02765, partial [Candidatus Bipolaricaulota bacterium]|nr:hypothetical protein [Candidatus Bipolaricaulota bacterium]